MATALSATCGTTSLIVSASLQRSFTASTVKPSVVGVPALKKYRINCCTNKSWERKSSVNNGNILLSAAVMGAVVSGPALALVDDRLSTEGTGLGLGLSNPILGWILVGVFTVIWSLYFVYTTILDEDEESGLSL